MGAWAGPEQTGRHCDRMEKGMLLTSSPHRGATFRQIPMLRTRAIDPADGRRVGAVLRVGPPRTAEPETSSHDIVEEWGMQSFPASDPPADW